MRCSTNAVEGTGVEREDALATPSLFKVLSSTVAILVAVATSGCSDARTANRYRLLSETGLYVDTATKTLAPDLLEYEPAFHLWSDGAEKRRWLRLPANDRIDTSDMDHWSFPVGAKLFKEFALAGSRLETRLVERTGPGADDYFMGAFLWRADQSDAELVTSGAKNVRGTEHDVPNQKQCGFCHGGEPGRVLGFSAIQLSGKPQSAVTLTSLAAQALLTRPPPAGAELAVPGDPVASTALGYLHANCGNCHNPNGLAWQYNKQVLRLAVAERAPGTTELYSTTIGVAIEPFTGAPVFAPLPKRVVPGNPDASEIVKRMSRRDAGSADWEPPPIGCCAEREHLQEWQMPPLATEQVDQRGVDAVRAWIAALPVTGGTGPVTPPHE